MKRASGHILLGGVSGRVSRGEAGPPPRSVGAREQEMDLRIAKPDRQCRPGEGGQDPTERALVTIPGSNLAFPTFGPRPRRPSLRSPEQCYRAVAMGAPGVGG